MDVVIRKASREDSRFISEMLFEMDPELFTFMFFDDEARTVDLLEKLVECENTVYTHKSTYIAQVDGRRAGFIYFVDDQQYRQNNEGMRYVFKQSFGLLNFLKHLNRFFWIFSVKLPIDGHALFCENICVAQEFRGRGIGTRLMVFAEEEARRRHASRLLGGVMEKNQDAKRLWDRLGFRVISRVTISKKLNLYLLTFEKHLS